VLGGAVLGSRALMEGAHTFRHRRPDAVGVQRLGDPEGMETLALCMERIRRMLALAHGWKRAAAGFARGIPGCPHPQHQLGWRSKKPAAASSHSS
jgi:hypothetical protein